MSLEVKAPLTGIVWQLHHQAGTQVKAGEVVVTLESMKMEVPVEAPQAGTLKKIEVLQGAAVSEGDVLFSLE